MPLYRFEGKEPSLGKGTFVYPSADIIGDVTIGKNCYIGPGARIRGDYGTIRIGDHTAVEENVVIHARPDDVTVIGCHVTIGHAAIIHDWAVIGMGAIVSDWAQLGTWAVVAEGAVVKNKQVIPERSIAVGVPAQVRSTITSDYEQLWTRYKTIYAELASKRLPASLERIK
jgi:phenylacetic acid degradation protein